MLTPLIPPILAAALLVWLAWRVGQPLLRSRPKQPQPPQQLDRRALFLSKMIAREHQRLAAVLAAAGPEPAYIPDDADTPPPKRSRPRKNPTLAHPAKQPVQTLVSGLKLHVQFLYADAPAPRQAVVISACGHVEPDGGHNVTTLRCICTEARSWRTFRLDRIKNLVDLTTGEIIPDPKAWITQLLDRIA